METWIDYKLNREYNEVRNRPHPYEISLYYDVQIKTQRKKIERLQAVRFFDLTKTT